MRLSRLGVGELWLVGYVVHTEDRAEVHPEMLFAGATTMYLPSLQRNACHGVMNGCAEPCGFWSSPVLSKEGADVREHLDHHVEHRDVDVRARARFPAGPRPREQGDRGEHPASRSAIGFP